MFKYRYKYIEFWYISPVTSKVVFLFNKFSISLQTFFSFDQLAVWVITNKYVDRMVKSSALVSEKLILFV